MSVPLSVDVSVSLLRPDPSYFRQSSAANGESTAEFLASPALGDLPWRSKRFDVDRLRSDTPWTGEVLQSLRQLPESESLALFFLGSQSALALSCRSPDFCLAAVKMSDSVVFVPHEAMVATLQKEDADGDGVRFSACFLGPDGFLDLCPLASGADLPDEPVFTPLPLARNLSELPFSSLTLAALDVRGFYCKLKTLLSASSLRAQPLHYVMMLTNPRTNQRILVAVVIPADYTSRRMVAFSSDKSQLYASSSIQSLGEVLSAIGMGRLATPFHRSDLTTVLGTLRQSVDGIRQVEAVRVRFFGLADGGCASAPPPVRLQPLSDELYVLQFSHRIKGLRSALVRPFQRDLRLERMCIDQECRLLKGELSLCRAVLDVPPRSCSINKVEELAASLRKQKLLKEKEEQSRLEQEINFAVSNQLTRDLKEVAETRRLLEEEERQHIDVVNELDAYVGNDAEFQEKVARLSEDLRDADAVALDVRSAAEQLFRQVEQCRERIKFLTERLATSGEDIRQAMDARAQRHVADVASRVKERAERNQQRAEWRQLLLQVDALVQDEQEFNIVKEPLTREMLSLMKRTLEGIKTLIDESDMQLELIADEEKNQQIAVQLIAKHPVNWSLEDPETTRLKQEGLLKEAEGKDQQLDALLEQVVQYLQHGTRLFKYRPYSKPHPKFFFVSADRKSLLWCDPRGEDGERAKAKEIGFADVRSLMLGQFSPLFQKWGSSFGSEDFYRSFTIFYGKDGRSLDVTAETDADFEAWLMGISALVNVEPRWGSGIDISNEPGYHELDIEEIDLCQQFHISPYFYLECRNFVLELQRKRGYVTRYDMRMSTGMDILRCIKMHDMLIRRGKITPRPVGAAE